MVETIISNATLEDILMRGLVTAIEIKSTEIRERKANEAQQEIFEAVRKEVSNTALNITKMVSINRRGNELTITIRDDRDGNECKD